MDSSLEEEIVRLSRPPSKQGTGSNNPEQERGSTFDAAQGIPTSTAVLQPQNGQLAGTGVDNAAMPPQAPAQRLRRGSSGSSSGGSLRSPGQHRGGLAADCTHVTARLDIHRLCWCSLCSVRMSASKKRCLCKWSICRSLGGVGEVRVPKEKRREFDDILGLEGECLQKADPRLWLGHFAASDVAADETGSGAAGTEVCLKLRKGALPLRTEAEIAEQAQGAVSKWLRSQAVAKRHELALIRESVQKQETAAKLRKAKDRVEELEIRIRQGGGGPQGKGKATASRLESDESTGHVRCKIDHTLLDSTGQDICRAICGLRSAESLQNLLDFLNTEGAIDDMNFYNADPKQAAGVRDDGQRMTKRSKVLGGKNGLFFSLFVMRTATSLRVASTLFGVSESVGGRAFTSWLSFLHGSLRPVVRLPDVDDVIPTAPQNFQKKGLSSVAVVIDATEIRVDKVWQSDAERALWSQYKKTHTAKILVCITPAGAICHVSDAYAGRISDVEIVKESGIIEELKVGGFGDRGMHVMADRGFNSIAPLLLEIGMHYVAPPSKRKGESQFSEEDAKVTRDVANLRIHVERAIGAMKEWRILDRKFDSQQMDNIGVIAIVCAAMVNLTRRPFVSCN